MHQQAKPDGLCWVDVDGNEIDDSNIGEVEVYGEGEQLPTLVVDTNTRIVKQVGENETFPYICQFAKPVEGKILVYTAAIKQKYFLSFKKVVLRRAMSLEMKIHATGTLFFFILNKQV